MGHIQLCYPLESPADLSQWSAVVEFGDGCFDLNEVPTYNPQKGEKSSGPMARNLCSFPKPQWSQWSQQFHESALEKLP